jgi:hypothetical protein
VRTHPVDKLLNSIATSLLQVCYNSRVFTYVVWTWWFFCQNKLTKSYILEKRREYLHQTAFFEVSWLNAMNKYLYDLEKNKKVIDWVLYPTKGYYPTKLRTLGIEPPHRTGTDFIILNVELNVIKIVQLYMELIGLIKLYLRSTLLDLVFNPNSNFVNRIDNSHYRLILKLSKEMQINHHS